MGCLTIGELYQAELDELIALAGTTVTYYPVVLTGYSTSTQSRSPSEGSPQTVSGSFAEETKTAPDGAITHSTTFTMSASALSGTPNPGDRIVHQGQHYRVADLRQAWFGAVLVNYVLTLRN